MAQELDEKANIEAKMLTRTQIRREIEYSIKKVQSSEANDWTLGELDERLNVLNCKCAELDSINKEILCGKMHTPYNFNDIFDENMNLDELTIKAKGKIRDRIFSLTSKQQATSSGESHVDVDRVEQLRQKLIDEH